MATEVRKNWIDMGTVEKRIVFGVIVVYVSSLIYTITDIATTRSKKYDENQVYYMIVTLTTITMLAIFSNIGYFIETPNNMGDNHETIRFVCMVYVFLLFSLIFKIGYESFENMVPRKDFVPLVVFPVFYGVFLIMLYAIQNKLLEGLITNKYVLFVFDQMYILPKYFSVLQLNIIVVIVLTFVYYMILHGTSLTGNPGIMSFICKDNLFVSKKGRSSININCKKSILSEFLFIPYFISSAFLFYELIWLKIKI